MSRRPENLNLSKKNHRELSDFITQELLYDYYFKTLDAETRSVLEKKISDDRESQAEVARFKLADEYLKELKKYRVKDQNIDELKAYETIFQSVEKKFRSTRVPAGVKWAFEGAIGVGVLILILSFLPFNKLTQFRWSFDGPAILARIDKDSEAPIEETVSPEKPVVAANESSEVVKEQGGTKKEIESFSFKDEGITDNSKTEKPAKIEKEKTTAGATDAAEPGAPRGLIFRSNLSVVNAGAAAEKITEQIKILGGQRAGEVEIGWQRDDTNYYYHFTIPEAKYAEMEEFIRQYGTFTVSEEKHPRKIPANLRRYIFTVSEKKQ